MARSLAQDGVVVRGAEKMTKKHPTRCRIIDVTGQEIYPGIIGRTPEVSKPHIGKEGQAEDLGNSNVRITLDDGTILEGCDCWWEAIRDVRE